MVQWLVTLPYKREVLGSIPVKRNLNPILPYNWHFKFDRCLHKNSVLAGTNIIKPTQSQIVILKVRRLVTPLVHLRMM